MICPTLNKKINIDDCFDKCGCPCPFLKDHYEEIKEEEKKESRKS